MPLGDSGADLNYVPTEADVTKAKRQILVTARPMREITADSVLALQDANAEETRFFLLGDALVSVRRGEIAGVSGVWGVHSEPLGPTHLKGALDRIADFVRLDEKGRSSPARPPNDVVSDILAFFDLPLPRLRGIIRAPAMSKDARLIWRPGFDTASGLYLDWEHRLHPRMSLDKALVFIEFELFGDFPFVDAASRAHALALYLAPFARELIDGLLPMWLIEAPDAGHGKGLLADIISIVAFGSSAPVMAQPGQEDETRKRITALLMEAHPLLLLDNVSRLDSEALAAALTSRIWRDRALGYNRIVAVPNNAIWLATGNNVECSREIRRRLLPIRLDAGMENPQFRTGFRHPELRKWAKANRALLITAALSIIASWVDAGMPLAKKTLGSFEEAASVLGGILEFAGVEGFLQQATQLAGDREWNELVAVWWACFQSEPVTAGQLLPLLKERSLLPHLWSGREYLASTQRLGSAVAEHQGRAFSSLRLASSGRDARTKSLQYRLEPIREDSETPETTATPFEARVP